MFVDFRLDQVEGEVFPAVLRFELGERQAVLELACHLELKHTLDFLFSGSRGGVVPTYLANLSPPEDSVGHDLGLVVFPWGGHSEDRG